ncbi:non-specific serine/threonine protein kinase [Entamoeba marina]
MEMNAIGPYDNYDMIERIGQGSFGRVYKAFHTNTRKIVAIKRLTKDADFQDIRKEIDMLKVLRSPYIIQYYTSVVRNEEFWIIMEYCFYGSVADMMDILNITLSEDVIAQICYDALNGLKYLHEMKKIHRDIKPANFLITQTGDVKLGDFGIATTLNEKSCHHKTLIGTPYFLAPEIVNESGYNEKVDIWALGISIIEMAEMKPPYYNQLPMRVLMLILQNPPPKLSNENEHSYNLQQFLSNSLIKMSKLRPSAYTLLRHPFIATKNKQNFLLLLDRLLEKIQECGGIEKALQLARNQKTEPTIPKQIDVSNRQNTPQGGNYEDLFDYLDMVVDDIPADTQFVQSQQNTADLDFISKFQDIVDHNNVDEEQKKPTQRYSPVPSIFPTQFTEASFDDSLSSFESTSIQTEAPPLFNGKGYLEQDNRKDTSSLAPSVFGDGFGLTHPFLPPRRDSQRDETRAPMISSNIEITTEHIENVDNEIYKITSEWKGITAGGCPAFPTWRNNTQFSLHVHEKTQIRISLEQIAEEGNLTHIAFYTLVAQDVEDKERILDLDRDSAFGESATFSLKRKIEEIHEIEAGWYIIFGCTYHSGVERKYILEFEYADGAVDVKCINEKETDWKLYTISGDWTHRNNGGTIESNNYQWCDNPKFIITLTQQTQLFLLLTTIDQSIDEEIEFFIFKTKEDDSPLAVLTPGNIKEESEIGDDNSAYLFTELAVGTYIIVPCPTDTNARFGFKLYAYAMSEILFMPYNATKTSMISGKWAEKTSGEKNTQFHLTTRDRVKLAIVLVFGNGSPEERVSMSLALIKASGGCKILSIEQSQIVFSSGFTNASYISKVVELEAGEYIVIPMTIIPNAYGDYNIVIHEILNSTFQDSCLKLQQIPELSSVYVNGDDGIFDQGVIFDIGSGKCQMVLYSNTNIQSTDNKRLIVRGQTTSELYFDSDVTDQKNVFIIELNFVIPTRIIVEITSENTPLESYVLALYANEVILVS